MVCFYEIKTIPLSVVVKSKDGEILGLFSWFVSA